MEIEELENIQSCLEEYMRVLEEDPNFDIDDEVFEKYERVKQAYNSLEKLSE